MSAVLLVAGVVLSGCRAALPVAGAAAARAEELRGSLAALPGGVTAFSQEGTGSAGRYETPAEAEKRAVEDALRRVMETAGADVWYASADFLSESGADRRSAAAQYLLRWSGAVMEYRVAGAPSFEALADGSVRCRATVAGRMRTRGRPDPSFRIVPEGDDGLGRTVYADRDEVRLSFRVTHDAYVHVLYADDGGRLYAVYPNRYAAQRLVRAGEVFSVPDRRAGFRLKAVLGRGRRESTEVLHIILTRGRPLFTAGEAGASPDGRWSPGDISAVAQRLGLLDRGDWAMYVMPFTVTARRRSVP